MRLAARWLALGALCAVANLAHSAATFQFRYADGAGEGLNDNSAFTPEGGNTATTLGEARRKVLDEAGRIWGQLLTSSIPIIVEARFDPLQCTQNSAALAQAGTVYIFRNPAGPQPNVFYTSALADALLGTNNTESSTDTAGSADINVVVNLTLHNNSSCFSGSRFYYGLDHNPGFNQPDLLQVLLHEIAHGLGFVSFVNLTTGNGVISNGTERFGAFDHFLYDEFLNQPWVALTASERLQAAARSGFLAWNGNSVNNWRNRFSAGVSANGRMLMYAPATISSGSSVSHWDTALTPYALMEPFRERANGSFTDITSCALKDIGWTVSRCIDSANTVPLAQAGTATLVEDTPTSITLTGFDGDGDALTFAIATGPAKGTVSGLAGGTLLYTPNPNATGADSFTFTASDQAATSTVGTVSISITPVNDAPVAAALTASVESSKSVGITLSGADVDGDVLGYTIVSGPSSGSLSGTGANVSYRSNNGFSGTDSFTYRANDAALASNTATVTITVTAASSGGGSGGGGGGAAGVPLLALLGGLLAFTRWRAAPRGH